MKSDKKGSSEDFYWIFILFGAAVGAGILFLPIQAGIGGFWVLLTVSLIIYFMVYPPHKLFARLINYAEDAEDYTSAVKYFIGKKVGMFVSLIFVMFLLSLMMAYAIGLNNDIGEFILDNNFTDKNPAHGPYLSIIILITYIAILKFGKELLIKALGILSFVLVLLILAISLLLIEMWDFNGLFAFPSFYEFIKQLFLVLPILLMAFVFFSTVSPMVAHFQKKSNSPEELEYRYSRIIKYTSIIILTFVLFFVFSCIFAISADQLKTADAKNISVLALLGSLGDKAFLREFGPIISIIALTTSFFGVALGIRNSSLEILTSLFKDKHSRKAKKISEIIFYSFLTIFLWIITISNINIIKLTGEIITPMISIILYFVPVYIVFQIERFKKYRTVGNIMIFVAGLIFFVSFYLGKMM